MLLALTIHAVAQVIPGLAPALVPALAPATDGYGNPAFVPALAPAVAPTFMPTAAPTAPPTAAPTAPSAPTGTSYLKIIWCQPKCNAATIDQQMPAAIANAGVTNVTLVPGSTACGWTCPAGAVSRKLLQTDSTALTANTTYTGTSAALTNLVNAIWLGSVSGVPSKSIMILDGSPQVPPPSANGACSTVNAAFTGPCTSCNVLSGTNLLTKCPPASTPGLLSCTCCGCAGSTRSRSDSLAYGRLVMLPAAGTSSIALCGAAQLAMPGVPIYYYALTVTPYANGTLPLPSLCPAPPPTSSQSKKGLYGLFALLALIPIGIAIIVILICCAKDKKEPPPPAQVHFAAFENPPPPLVVSQQPVPLYPQAYTVTPGGPPPMVGTVGVNPV